MPMPCDRTAKQSTRVGRLLQPLCVDVNCSFELEPPSLDPEETLDQSFWLQFVFPLVISFFGWDSLWIITYSSCVLACTSTRSHLLSVAKQGLGFR